MLLSVPRRPRRTRHTALALILGGMILGGPDQAAAQDDLARSLRSTNAPVQINADKLVYVPADGTVTATGKVEISQGERILLADKLTYNEKTRVVAASGNVALLEPNGEVVFADYIELDDQFTRGFIQTLNLLFSDNSRAAAESATRTDGNITILDKAVYSPCKICAEHPDRAPLWQIKAVKVIHDQKAKTVEYEDATFEVFGVPIGYTPYFAHPDPSVKRASGFLLPSLGSSNRLGFHTSIPYFWAIDDQRDLTITPHVTTKEGPFLVLDYRDLVGTGGMSVETSFSVGDERRDNGSKTGSEEFRGHIFANGQYALDQNWRWGFLAERTTSDTYLKRFGFDSPNFLTSELYAEGFFDRSYVSVVSTAYQDLRDGADRGLTPYIAPVAQFSYVHEPDEIGGRVAVDGSALALWREDGADQRRVSLSMNWQRPWILDVGLVTTVTMSLRGDLYDTSDLFDLAGNDRGGVTARALPQAAVEFRYPFVRTSSLGRQVIEPIAQFVLAPRLGTSPKISNEDSQSFEFDVTNLFALDRFPGYDLIDSGSRAVLGLRGAHYGNKGETLEVLLGQSFEITNNDGNYPARAGVGNGRSDYVGRVVFSPDSWIDIQDTFRIDRDNFQLNSNDTRLGLGDGNYRAYVGYSSVKTPTGFADQDDRDEIYISGYAKVERNWLLYGDMRRQLNDDSQLISSRLGLFYMDECVEIGGVYRRDRTRDRDISPSNSINFVIRLKNLG